MVTISRLEVMGIFSAYRVYFKYFLNKINMSMCSGMLLDPNAFKCDILSCCSESLLIEKHLRYSIPKFWLSYSNRLCSDQMKI